MAMVRECPVTPVKNVPAQRRDRYKIERIRPPDAFHRVTIGVGALDLLAVFQQQAQVLHEFVFVQLQFFFDPVRLKRRDFKSSFPQRVFPERNPAAAESTRIVVENPACRLFGNTHRQMQIPSDTLISEPSAKNVDDGGWFKAS